MTTETTCATCRWFDPPAPGLRLGDCDWAVRHALPRWMPDVYFYPKASDAEDCAAWEPKAS